jgi:hypothetical protein
VPHGPPLMLLGPTFGVSPGEQHLKIGVREGNWFLHCEIGIRPAVDNATSNGITVPGSGSGLPPPPSCASAACFCGAGSNQTVIRTATQSTPNTTRDHRRDERIRRATMERFLRHVLERLRRDRIVRSHLAKAKSSQRLTNECYRLRLELL